MNASATVDPQRSLGQIDRRIFGAFVEHLGRHIYDGIFEPGHPSADENGFRTDVIELVKELGVSTIRYPGGNFVSGYNWEDGVGPRDQRPERLDLAWHTTETNQVGLHEFADWCDAVGSDMMMAVNLGTRGVAEALALLEYCNVPNPTTRTRQRAANGHPDPFGIKMWCLGNEMDGPWQVGHRSAEDYAKIASQTAKAMKMLDNSLEFVACGSSSRAMPTFGKWEETVLEHAFDDLDFISCHAYYEEIDGDTQEFLTSAADMDLFIKQVVAVCDAAAAKHNSDKQIMISFDEWNVWYLTEWQKIEGKIPVDVWPTAPRLLEDSYNVKDAVVVGDLLITLLRHSDRVRSASLAQLVNVIAPIMTEPGGPTWRQTTFFPFSITSRLTAGESIPVDVECPTVFSRKANADVPTVNAVATLDEKGISLFVVNRSLTDAFDLGVDLSQLAGGRVLTLAEAHVIADEDLTAANTLTDPQRVAPEALEVAVGAMVSAQLPPVSWAAIRLTF
ncbi:arabinosylfuranosidase ArfA [Tessaracoccus lacteus]|uniref:non-reducing end alpha-L-arabinofuranosidase n=1 Tax=Tessaracoccus lacteus TaxID=3041766 RepID=A0ABY8Q0C5_9ACTN|nr:alpha-N-arabinofuranosidase [Tessaracoccus sp. T21]WGT48197.1 alpha-N-arabinofuranosidase [Tessaracoccus sp. T21]